MKESIACHENEPLFLRKQGGPTGKTVLASLCLRKMNRSVMRRVVALCCHSPMQTGSCIKRYTTRFFVGKKRGRAAIYESPCCRCRQGRMDRLPVLLVLHQRSKQQKDALAQTFFCPTAAKLLPGVRVAAFDVLVVDAVVAGNGVVCIKYAAHLVIHL